MAGQADFLERINELERMARTNGDCLSMQEIRDYFGDMELSDQQFDYICKFLEGKGILIEDRVERVEEDVEDLPVETKADEEDDAIASIYISEAQSAHALSDQELSACVSALIKGDQEASARLIEGNLSRAIAIAGEFRNKGLLYSDLIQEANMGLMMAVSDLSFAADTDRISEVLSQDPTWAGTTIDEAIRRHLREALGIYNSSTRSAMKMAERINDLNARTMTFAKENGREAKPDELAKIMGLSEDEIRELMKISLDAVSIMGSDEIGDMDQLGELAASSEEETFD